MNTSNELLKEDKVKKYEVISSEYPKPEKEIDTKVTLDQIINPRIAYYKSGKKLEIILDINVQDEEEKRKYYYLNKK